MSVSSDHELMVSHLIKWIDGGEGPIGVQNLFCECSYHPEIKNFPPNINGHRPDVFASAKGDPTLLLIGEAKTTQDLETQRTEIQLGAFARHLTELGKGYLALGVTWNNVPSARSLLKKIMIREGAQEIIPIVVDCSTTLANGNT